VWFLKEYLFPKAETVFIPLRDPSVSIPLCTYSPFFHSLLPGERWPAQPQAETGETSFSPRLLPCRLEHVKPLPFLAHRHRPLREGVQEPPSVEERRNEKGKSSLLSSFIILGERSLGHVSMRVAWRLSLAYCKVRARPLEQVSSTRSTRGSSISRRGGFFPLFTARCAPEASLAFLPPPELAAWISPYY